MSSARQNQSEKSQKSNLPTHKIRLARIIEHPQTIFCQGIYIKDGVSRAQRCCAIKRTHTEFVHKCNNLSYSKYEKIHHAIVSRVTTLKSLLFQYNIQRIIQQAQMVVIVWQLDLQLPMQSVSITTNVVSSNPAQGRCTRYNIL